MRVVFLLAASISFEGAALAYSDGTVFARDPSAETSGGGGGLYFTGSPRQHGLECGSCHVDGPAERTKLRLTALVDGEPASLFTKGYEPGRTYEIEVAFDADPVQPVGGCDNRDDEPCDVSSFALEILDGDGRPAGDFCPIEPRAEAAEGPCGACPATRAKGAIVEAGCSVVIGDAFDVATLSWRNAQTAYAFYWRAPSADLGVLTTYVSAVDGGGRDAEDAEVTSYAGDAVATFRAKLGSPSQPAAESCQAVGSGGSLYVLSCALVLALRIVAPRVRRFA